MINADFVENSAEGDEDYQRKVRNISSNKQNIQN
jgi:hypothetical protein